MDPLRRTGVAEHAAGLLEREIAAGRLSGKLPSTRNLATLLKVSRPTLLQALQLLQSKGLIQQSGRQQIYSVVDSPMTAAITLAKPAGDRNALFLLDQEGPQNEAFEILLSLAMNLHDKGWRISSLRLNYGHSENRPRQWQRAIEGYAPDKVIVMIGNDQLAQWLHRANIPALFIGGQMSEIPIPMFSTSGPRAMAFIVNELLRNGHERIWVPLCNRRERYSARLQETVRTEFGRHGLAFSHRLNTPTSPYQGPDVIVAMFEEAWRNFRPTAIILHDWREYIAVSSALRREGLDIPKHISVVLIGGDSEMDWHIPKLAHFRAPLGRLASACAKWLTSDDTKQPLRSRVFETEWVPGKSIAEPRAD